MRIFHLFVFWLDSIDFSSTEKVHALITEEMAVLTSQNLFDWFIDFYIILYLLISNRVLFYKSTNHIVHNTPKIRKVLVIISTLIVNCQLYWTVSFWWSIVNKQMTALVTTEVITNCCQFGMNEVKNNPSKSCMEIGRQGQAKYPNLPAMVCRMYAEMCCTKQLQKDYCKMGKEMAEYVPHLFKWKNKIDIRAC